MFLQVCVLDALHAKKSFNFYLWPIKSWSFLCVFFVVSQVLVAEFFSRVLWSKCSIFHAFNWPYRIDLHTVWNQLSFSNEPGKQTISQLEIAHFMFESLHSMFSVNFYTHKKPVTFIKFVARKTLKRFRFLLLLCIRICMCN